MSWSIEIPGDLQKRIAAEANLRGLDAASYAIQVLNSSVPAPANGAKSGKEVIERWRAAGLVGDWADRVDLGDSSSYARELREAAQRRDAS